MKKVVNWGEPKISSAKRPQGSYGSLSEFLQKANAQQAEQDQAIEYLQKMNPAMVALLEYKLKTHDPLIVMRPLHYQTSDIEKGEVDDGFYNQRKNQNAKVKFVDVVRTIVPGTQLILKSLDMTLQEFVFNDALGKEHAINFCDRDKLMTQTNVFEEVKSYLEGKGE